MSIKGVAIAGNMVTDVLYPIEHTPKPGELTTIFEGITESTGGAVNNTAMDMAALDPTLPIKVIGKMGADEHGEFIKEKLSAYPNIDYSGLLENGNTSFTLVMADGVEKVRTFYHYRGSNAEFCQEDIDLDNLDVDLFHIGYILLLDTLDQEDPEYGTKMARLLHDVQAKGIKTSFDVVSESGDRFKRIVGPAMRYTDYCIINEVEAQATTGVMLRDEEDKFHPENMKAALQAMKDLGVSTWAVIHCKEGGYGLDENGNYYEDLSLDFPRDQIVGTVGAGDAFCAGALLGAVRGLPLEDALKLATASATCSLRSSDASGSMCTAEEAMELYKQYR